MIKWAKDLFPLCRSLIGEGNRKTIKYFKKINPEFKILKFKSGSKVFDWIIPKEWNVSEAWIKNSKGEKVQDTQWHNVVAWGKTAEIVENYVGTGKEIAIEGKLTTRSYESKEGEKRYVTEVIASEILLLGNGTAKAESQQ